MRGSGAHNRKSGDRNTSPFGAIVGDRFRRAGSGAGQNQNRRNETELHRTAMRHNKATLEVMKPKPTGETEMIATHLREMLKQIGENPEREGLVRTPERFARALQFLTSGYHADIKKIVNGAIFTEPSCDELVIVRDIEF